MKETLHYRGMIKILLPLLVVTALIIVSCDKKGSDIQPNPTPPTPPAVLPSISWTITPTDTRRKDTSFYMEPRIISIDVLNADSSGIVGASGSSVTTGAVTGPLTFNAWAKNSAGTTTSTKTIPMFTERKTNLTGGVNGVKWAQDSFFVATIPDSLTTPDQSAWEDISSLIFRELSYQFFTDNSATSYISSGPSAGQYHRAGIYSLQMNETHILFTDAMDLQRIVELTPNRMVLTQIQKVGGSSNYAKLRWVYLLRP